MQKIVLKVGLHDDKIKQKAMKIVSGIQGVDSIALAFKGGFNSSGIQGVDSIAVDMKEKQMTVVGGIDPVKVAGKLRKLSEAEIVSVGPKEELKKEEPKKEEKKPEPEPCVCHAYIDPPYPYYCVIPVQQDPVGCVIC